MTQPIHTREDFTGLGDDALQAEIRYFTERVITTARTYEVARLSARDATELEAAREDYRAAVEGFKAAADEAVSRVRVKIRRGEVAA